MPMRLHPVASFIVLLLVTASGCAPLFEKPRLSVRRVDINGVTFRDVSFTLVCAVENPNVLGLDLARLSYQLTVDGHNLVQGAGDHVLHVPAQGTGELHLPITVRFTDLAEALTSLFTKRQVPFKIDSRLGFGTPIGVIDVPLAHSGTLPVPQLPTLSLGNANAPSFSRSGGQVSLTLLVRNNNTFALPVGPLHYAVTINGAPLVNAATAPQQLAANATVPVVISAQLDYLRVGLGVLRAVESGSATVALDGNFDLMGFDMPVHLQTTLRP